ncbi:hypothetical protein [Isoptericola sediminis]|uniref:Uncharacterized protein n=1 Tax=Isoptericola sediminis TaxID=2733572 RepID=A0A849K421_9MICO|nr:hypothetical protein [Isoptericola sediminis]NNU26789.1 hypothetical protein [Isoptericola sediminis]
MLVDLPDASRTPLAADVDRVAYLADVLGERPLTLDRDERREVVAMPAGEGMSTRVIAPIAGVRSEWTIRADLAASHVRDHLAPGQLAETGGLDGKTYTAR